MTFYIPWQGASAYGGDDVGHGPDKMRAAGCVVSTAAILRAELRPDLPRLTPGEVNAKLRAVPGAFVDGSPAAKPGDLLSWPAAAPELGLRVGPSFTRGAMLESAFAQKIEEAFATGGRLAVRVSVKPGATQGQHTIAGLRLGVKAILCGCPALADQVLLSRPALVDETIKWNGIPHPYRVVAVRPVFSAIA